MRVRNKELRQRRHRKEQRVKELISQAKAEAKSGVKKPKGAKAAPAPKKAAPAPKAEVKATEEVVEAKPKRAPKKKAEEAPAESAE